MFNQGQLSNDPKSSNKKRLKYDEDIDTAMNISDEPQDNQTTQTSKNQIVESLHQIVGIIKTCYVR